MILRAGILIFLTLLTLAAFALEVPGAAIMLALTALIGALLLPQKYLKTMLFLLAAVTACAIVIYYVLLLALKFADYPVNSSSVGPVVILSISVSIGIVAMVLLLQLYIASEGILGLSQYLSVTRPEAMRMLAGRMAGLQPPYLIIENGKVEVASKGERLSTLGGLGLLIVRPATAAVLEWGGTTSAIVGPGTHSLRQFEKVATIIDLRPQLGSLRNITVQTSEGIGLQITVEYTYRIEDDQLLKTRKEEKISETTVLFGETANPISGYNKDPIGRAAYKAPGGDWRTATDMAMLMAVNEVFASNTIELIFGVRAGTPTLTLRALRGGLANAIKRNAWARTAEWGVAIETTAIEEVPAPNSVVNKILSQLDADSDSNRIAKMGRGEAAAIASIETARRTASEEYLGLLEDTVTRMANSPLTADVVPLYLALVERLAHEVSGDRTSAYRYLQTLEAMSRHPDANVIISAGESDINIAGPLNAAGHNRASNP